MTIFNQRRPDFRKIKGETDLLLLSAKSIETFPFSIKKLIREKTNLGIKTYSKAGSYGVVMEDFGSMDALLQTDQNSGRSIIFFNDEIASKERIKFSFSHELGHYFLRHDKEDYSGYDIHEIEANFFAAQLLMPQQIIFELMRRGADITVSNLQKWFGVSKQAAQKRLETLNKINLEYQTEDEKEIDEMLISKFRPIIDSICPKRNFSNWFDKEEMLQKERESWY